MYFLIEQTVVPVTSGVDNNEVKGDEFWDYDQQIDLEAFSTREFYGTLAKQTSEITAALARQKDQVGGENILLSTKFL